MMRNSVREIDEVLVAQAASDGDGVRLKRVFGGGDLSRFDPFLMLDEFGSEQASDYIGGFPSHPHRGFETVTYMLAGHMEHRDHMDNVGRLGPGDVQWMKAGSGVIHSEMPQQESGKMQGFQLWVNLPAAEKMTPAAYDDIAADSIPDYRVRQISIKAIAGYLRADDLVLEGAVSGKSTDPGYLDIGFTEPDHIELTIPEGYTGLVYVYAGSARVGNQDYVLKAGTLARTSRSGILQLQAEAGSRLLVITGNPIGEPIVQHGPFVMNTIEEIEQAIRDYSAGRLVRASAD